MPPSPAGDPGAAAARPQGPPYLRPGTAAVVLPGPLRRRRALRVFAMAVLEAREAFEGNAALFQQRAAELDGDDMAAGRCLGQAAAYKNAAELIGDAIGAATGRWDGGPGTAGGRDVTA